MSISDLIGLCLLGLFSVAATILWAMNIWGGWAEKMYERTKCSKSSYFWLNTFSIPSTHENCVLFLKIISSIGIAALTSFWIIGLIHFINKGL